MATGDPQSLPIGERLRRRRTDELAIGLREMARRLDVAASHVTDLEKGRRAPSDDLLKAIASQYDMPEAELRAGWGKAESDVARIAASNPVAASKAPELLRTASEFDESEWDALIDQARKLASRASRRSKPKPL